MFKVVIVGLGGFLGAVARYGLSGLVQRSARCSFPVGTLAVNVLGCLVIGALMCLAEERQFFTPNARLFLLIGLLGAFTTFSTLGYETFELLRSGDFGMAAWNAAGNLFAGLAAVMLGWTAVRSIGI